VGIAKEAHYFQCLISTFFVKNDALAT